MRLLVLIALIFSLAFGAIGQSADIEKTFAASRGKYTREFFSMGEDASSGYDYVFYKRGDKIVMIRVIWSASHRRELRIDDFYFDDSIVLYRKQTATKRQLSLLKRGREVPLVRKEEYHFADGKMTKWILGKKTIPSTDPDWAKTEADMLEHARLELENYAFLKEDQ